MSVIFGFRDSETAQSAARNRLEVRNNNYSIDIFFELELKVTGFITLSSARNWRASALRSGRGAGGGGGGGRAGPGSAPPLVTSRLKSAQRTSLLGSINTRSLG